MSICKFCGQDKEIIDSCISVPIKIKDVVYYPTPYGNEIRYGLESRDYENFSSRCPECNVKIGKFHHIGCSLEQCPVCDLPINQCGCVTEVWSE